MANAYIGYTAHVIAKNRTPNRLEIKLRTIDFQVRKGFFSYLTCVMFMCVVSVRSNRDFVLFEGDAALSDGDAGFGAGVMVFSPFAVLPDSMSRVVLVGEISNFSIDI